MTKREKQVIRRFDANRHLGEVWRCLKMLGLESDKIKAAFWKEYDENQRPNAVGLKTFFHQWNIDYLNPLLIKHLELEPGHSFSTNLLYFMISEVEEEE